jgi:two-component system, NarL family, nitrate/nitrite response regulator NarL
MSRPPPAAPTLDPSAAVRVMVVADVRMYRDGLAAGLRAEPAVDVVAALSRPPSDLGAFAPDVVVYDVSRADALPAVRDLLRRAPAAKVVVVAIPERDGDLLAYAEAGVSGYVTSEQSVDDVAGAVRAVARGEMICTPRMAATLLHHVAALAAGIEAQPSPAGHPLTPRELDIVELIERGMSNKQIGRTLHIEVATVKNHVHNVLEKLHVQRRGEAAAQLRRHGLAAIPLPGTAADAADRPDSPVVARQQI